MIDAKCPIFQAGKGFCWAPSAAWGCSDEELCGKCKAKDRTFPKVIVPVVAAVSKKLCICGRGKKPNYAFCWQCVFEQGRKQVYVARKRAVA